LTLEELRSVLAGRTEVSFAAGFGIGTTENDEELLQEAVELANGADHVLVFLGLPGEDESEGFDRTHIDLPANQLVLLHALAEVHDRLIVILANGMWFGSPLGGAGSNAIFLGADLGGIRRHGTQPRRIGGAGRRALDRRVVSVSSRRSTADVDKSDGTPGIILQ
jgi:hypothetical protein